MLKKLSTLIFFAFSVFFLAGCTNLGKGHLFDSRIDVEAEKKQFSPPPAGLASVYLISDKVFMQEIMWVPQPSMGFTANDRLMTVAPRGSFVHFLFRPGRHKIGLANVPSEKNLKSARIVDVMHVDVEPGKTYFISTELKFPTGRKLKVFENDEGKKLVQEAKLAKSLHVPVSLEAFERQRQAIADEQRRKEDEEARRQAALAAERAQTAEGVADFFAAAAAVAVVALFVVGFGLAMSAGSPSYVPPSPPPSLPATSAYVSSTTAVRSGSGKTMQLETTRNSQVTSINNLSTGISYRLDGDRYVGTDGSWFRSAGNTIYSSTGNYYTRSGNVLTSNDGRQCQIIGSTISCN